MNVQSEEWDGREEGCEPITPVESIHQMWLPCSAFLLTDFLIDNIHKNCISKLYISSFCYTYL